MNRTATTGAILDHPIRTLLGRNWTLGLPDRVCLWIGHNPSLADADRDDPTIKRMVQFSERWGFDALEVANLIPFVTPDPKKAHWLNDEYGDTALKRNLPTLLAAAERAARVIVCWGEIAAPISELVRLACNQLTVVGVVPMCLGTTKSGAPIHPMARGRNRVPDDREPVPWGTEHAGAR